MLRVTFVTLLLFVVIIPLTAGVITADYLTFRSARPPLAYVEVYFSIPNSLLHFIHTDEDRYEADIEVWFTATSPSNQRVISKQIDKKISTSYYHATRDYEVNNIFKFPLKMIPGLYNAHITLHDKNNNHRYSARLAVSVPDYSDSLSISSIKISRMNEDESIFNPLASFGFMNRKADVYFETYNINSNLLRTEISIVTPEDSLIRSIAQTVRTSRNHLAFEMPLSLDDLSMGAYKIRIVQHRPDDGKEAISEKKIFIMQSPIDLRFKDYQTAIEEIRYLITEQEYESMLNVPPEKQQQTLLEFWQKRDPTPETEKNEIMFEYYSRLYEAERYFTTSSLPGWQTDFGLIYVLFGPPDDILRYYRRDRFEERHVWRYRKLNLSFTFINWYNYNTYTLLDKKNIIARYVPNY